MNYREMNYSNEKEWHNIRRKHIGGSDCATIMGKERYKKNNKKSRGVLWKNQEELKREKAQPGM